MHQSETALIRQYSRVTKTHQLAQIASVLDGKNTALEHDGCPLFSGKMLAKSALIGRRLGRSLPCYHHYRSLVSPAPKYTPYRNIIHI